MVVIAYKWGGISFDDYTLSKILILPSDADDVEITFHDEEGQDYVVPEGHIFIVGKWALGVNSSSGGATFAQVGPSAAAEGAPTKILLSRAVGANAHAGYYDDVLAVFVAAEYVTALSSTSLVQQEADTVLYGVEVSIA